MLKESQYNKFMKLALELASRGKGATSPNPMVGAVLVRNGKIVGKGYHRKAGSLHAEVVAIKDSRGKAKGATLFVNLEPCVHYGKTPPCCDEIIRARISKVVIGMKDPNPLVNGKGIRKLKIHGIEVEVGVMEKEAEELNEAFIKSIKTGTPFVIMKSAMSLDGKIATRSGQSKWLTSKESRKFVQELRLGVDGIMVGIGTILKDDPRLSLRIKKREVNPPAKIIVDSQLKIPLRAELFSSKPDSEIIIATTASNGNERKLRKLRKMGAEIIQTRSRGGRVDLQELMKELCRKGLRSILLEGGAELNASAINEGIVDKVFYFYAPILIGGRNAKGTIGGEGITKLQDAGKIDIKEIKKIGKDLLVIGYVRN